MDTISVTAKQTPMCLKMEFLFSLLSLCALSFAPVNAQDLPKIIADAQVRCVKIYGAGGAQGLEAYQSGFIVSPVGHIATVWSYVLDATPLVVLDDGRKFKSDVVGFEPTLELAVLKIDADGLLFFPLDDEVQPVIGEAVLALSNAFGVATGAEPVSVMFGHIGARSKLAGRRGYFQTAYQGPILTLDLVANNPGAAGGALIDLEGRLAGMLGKELRDARTGAWLNYAIPSSELRPVLRDIVAGKTPELTMPDSQVLPVSKSQNLAQLGIVLVPNVLERTPPFIDTVVAGSPAAKAGLQADDLLILAGDTRIDSQATLFQLLRKTDRRDLLPLVIQRGTQLININLSP